MNEVEEAATDILEYSNNVAKANDLNTHQLVCALVMALNIITNGT